MKDDKVANADQTVSFESILDDKGYIVYTNVGFSMMPLLRQKKDVIEIRKKEPGRCKKYDVVLYKRNEKYILHRILKVLQDGYLIAGDHCTRIERDIKDEDILGVMTRVLRNGKYITPDKLWYMIYVHLWCDLYPVRMIALKAKFLMLRILKKLKRIIKRDFSKRPEQDSKNSEQKNVSDAILSGNIEEYTEE